MIGIIAAVTLNGVIGVDGKLPFDYPEDMKHFRKSTLDSTLIMGRKTFEGIGRPLPKRRNCVISSTKIDVPGVETFETVKSAVEASQGNVWFAGGASIYEEGMMYADQIWLTIVPEYNFSRRAVRFPWINPMMFKWYEGAPLDPEMYQAGTSKLLLHKYFRFVAGDTLIKGTSHSDKNLIEQAKIQTYK